MNSQNESILKVLNAKTEDIFNFPDKEKSKIEYAAGEPYPHIIIKDFFKPEIAETLANELLSHEDNFKTQYNNSVEKNKTISTGDAVPPIMRTISSKYASPEMLRFLESITGLKGLIGDPYYNTDYGYYHIVGPGGVLGSHVDHSHHTHLGLPHVLNIVVYLSKDWDDNAGGGLCLFDETGKKVVRRIPCEFNTAAVFACTPKAFHGVEPIKDGITQRRHSIYFAYYSTALAQKQLANSIPTMASEGTNEDVQYGTYFVMKFSDLFKWKNRNHLRLRIMSLVRMFIPPVFYSIFARKNRG